MANIELYKMPQKTNPGVNQYLSLFQSSEMHYAAALQQLPPSVGWNVITSRSKMPLIVKRALLCFFFFISSVLRGIVYVKGLESKKKKAQSSRSPTENSDLLTSCDITPSLICMMYAYIHGGSGAKNATVDAVSGAGSGTC